LLFNLFRILCRDYNGDDLEPAWALPNIKNEESDNNSFGGCLHGLPVPKIDPRINSDHVRVGDRVIRLRSALTALTVFCILCAGGLVVSGCGGGGPTAITIEILPNGTLSIDEGQTINFTALLGADTTNKGVTWMLTGGDCAGTGCGTLTNSTAMSVTYTAPGSLSAAISVTLTATSVAQTSKTQTQSIAVNLPPTFTTVSLPNGSNGVPYNQTIVVTGGVTPYTYKVTSGNLPPGVTLNSTTGQFVGSPSAPLAGQPPATYNFVVTVTDSGGVTLANPVGGISISEPLAITVTPPPTLTITSTSLPTATTNIQYTAAIQTHGGVAPLTFSLVGGGNFPVPGLTLNPATGVVSGVPTVAGPYSFQVKVTDSSLPVPGQSFPATIMLVVQSPPPLLITTPSLPNGVTATPYTGGSLQATGGVPPYTWSVIQGQLPSGLALTTLSNGTGNIGGDLGGPGIPTLAGTSTFTVQLQDSEVVPMKTTGAFTITITPGGANNVLFQGQYSFLFKGFDSGGSVALAGSLSADGAGNISGGIEDSNRSSGVLTGISFTGTYSIGSDGRGTLETKAIDPRNPNNIITTDYQLVLESNGNAHFFENNSTTTSTDTTGTHGEGILKPVLGSTFSAKSFSGNYAFGFSGQDFGGKPAAFAGVFNADGVQSLTLGTSDLNDAGTETSQALSGDFTFATANLGAAHFVFQPPSKSQTTLTFNFYFVSANDLFFVEVDTTGMPLSPPNPPRLSGEVILQQPSAAFGPATSLPGPSVATGTGTDGVKANIFAGLLPATTCNGITTFALSYDQNDGGTVAAPTSLSGTCTATPNGRVAFSWIQPPMPPAAAIAPRFVTAYLTGPGQGFLIGGDAAVTSGFAELQSGGPFADTSIQGSYALSARFPAETNVNNLLGQLNSNGAGSILGVIDEFTAPTVALPEGKANLGQSLSATINMVAANGRGILTNSGVVTGFPTNVIFYVVSPSTIRWMSADPGIADPQIISLDH
jgi:hypothetical protein